MADVPDTYPLDAVAERIIAPFPHRLAAHGTVPGASRDKLERATHLAEDADRFQTPAGWRRPARGATIPA